VRVDLADAEVGKSSGPQLFAQIAVALERISAALTRIAFASLLRRFKAL
jgi:hypothetical protein